MSRGFIYPEGGYVQEVGMSKWCAPSPLEMGYGIPWDTVGKQAVRILQECFLVVIELASELKMTTFQKRN